MKKFIGEEISVGFEKEFILEKKPPCPDSYTWRGTTYNIAELVASKLDA